MAALEVLPYSPSATPSTSAQWAPLSFDDFLDFPSPGIAPSSPRTSFALPSEPQPLAPGTVSVPVVPNMPSSSSEGQSASTPTTALTASAPRPPPPGSSPEVLFRYYLAAELRRIGSNADDKIIDKYVAQHYGSLTKNKSGQSSASAGQHVLPSPAPSGPGLAQTEPFGPEGTAVSSPGHGLRASPVAARLKDESLGIDPHMVELHQSNETPTALASKSTPAPSSHYETTDTLRLPLRSHKPQRDADDMSQDSEEELDDVGTLGNADELDSKSQLQKHLARTASGKSSRSARAGSAGTVSSESTGGADAHDGGSHSSAGHSRTIISAAAMLRPSPEEYQKLSSKEKRQLRNKISARNFRTRRKEHITTLEEQLDSRDAIIESLRSQVSTLTLANQQLVDEVKVLKTKQISQGDVQRILDALQRSASTNGTSSSTASAMAADSHSHAQRLPISRTASNSSLAGHANAGDVVMSSASRPATPSSPRPPILRRSSPSISGPNTRKDVAPSSSAFWGGANKASSALVAAS